MIRAAVVLACALVACGGAQPSPPATPSAGHGHGHGHGHADGAAAAHDDVETKLDEVAHAHGAAGAWAVAGYRMGEHALAKLGLPRGSFDLEIEHTTPKKVQYSCIADGAGASTGASVGKLNLRLKDGTEDAVVTVYRNKKTGASVALRPSSSFRAKFLDAQARDPRVLGREVMTLPPADVFEEVQVPAP